jgi:hypothetical protein
VAVVVVVVVVVATLMDRPEMGYFQRITTTTRRCVR